MLVIASCDDAGKLSSRQEFGVVAAVSAANADVAAGVTTRKAQRRTFP